MKAPQDVKSPQKDWRLEEDGVVFQGPDDGEDGFSVACGRWRNGDEFEARLAIRWNANENRPLGNPSSRMYPTWFILPDAVAYSVMTAVLPKITEPAARERLRYWVTKEMGRTA